MEEATNIRLLADDILEILIVDEVAIKGNGCRLDGDTTFLLVGTGIGSSGITCLSGRDDTSFCEKGVGKSGFSMVDMGNDGHAIVPKG